MDKERLKAVVTQKYWLAGPDSLPYRGLLVQGKLLPAQGCFLVVTVVADNCDVLTVCADDAYPTRSCAQSVQTNIENGPHNLVDALDCGERTRHSS
ncbi:hypothetical protein GCM10008955_33030 [Deinococcus malanensis]|uniref:Uncharacterized protein n=1 Tax=Deinococcus malanensis TaxID=1706855 RepID=A0ABQ2F3A6_9DEIO|nr:hypothetical protein GCM10008955_33030 [Deinococcus malanensis]